MKIRIQTNHNNYSTETVMLTVDNNTTKSIEREFEYEWLKETLPNVDSLTYIRIFLDQNSATGIELEISNFEIYVDDELVNYNYATLYPTEGSEFSSYPTETLSHLASKNYVDTSVSAVNENLSSSISSLEETLNSHITTTTSIEIDNTDYTQYLMENYYIVDETSDKPYKGMSYPIYIDYITDDREVMFKYAGDHIRVYNLFNVTDDYTLSTKNIEFTKPNKICSASTTLNIHRISAALPNTTGLKILTIGDSTTDGHGSEGQAYHFSLWRNIKREDIDFNRDSKCILLGTRNYNYSFEYNGITYSEKLCDEGYSGKNLSWFLTNSASPFYDESMESDIKFNINKYIERYRTLDDEGNQLTLDSENIGTDITSSNIDNIKVCKPDIVMITLGHNTFYTIWTQAQIDNYHTLYTNFISTLREQLPDAYIIINVCMPLVGSNHLDMYPEYLGLPQIAYNWTSNSNTNKAICINYLRNVKFWKQFESDNTDEHILICPLFNITPTIDSFKWFEFTDPNTNQKIFRTKNEYGNAHPYIPAHKAWSYLLYGIIKYIQYKESIKEE